MTAILAVFVVRVGVDPKLGVCPCVTRRTAETPASMVARLDVEGGTEGP